jgi:2-polyprenyl-3-methyl-5-hydroxy-6-metoxy-1,4-benzoquinol methylase
MMNQSQGIKSSDYYSVDRNEMLDFIPDNVRFVLEVGCGSGEFANSIKNTRPHSIIWGLEPEPQAALAASMKMDKVICGTFESAEQELRGQVFDCIIFNDVLEHMVYPQRVLHDCRRYLTKGGVVVASLPNILYFYEITKILWEEDWEYREYGILDNTHLRFFTRKSIIRMFEEAGYYVERVGGINPSAGWKFKFANLLMFGRLNDWRYVQFAVNARVT